MYKSKHECYTRGKLLKSFVDFRMCNNYLPVERDRWLRQEIRDRKCQLCNNSEVGDEYSFFFNNDRSLSCFICM